MPLIPEPWQGGTMIIGHRKAIFAVASAASHAAEVLSGWTATAAFAFAPSFAEEYVD